MPHSHQNWIFLAWYNNLRAFNLTRINTVYIYLEGGVRQYMPRSSKSIISLACERPLDNSNFCLWMVIDWSISSLFESSRSNYIKRCTLLDARALVLSYLYKIRLDRWTLTPHDVTDVTSQFMSNQLVNRKFEISLKKRTIGATCQQLGGLCLFLVAERRLLPETRLPLTSIVVLGERLCNVEPIDDACIWWDTWVLQYDLKQCSVRDFWSPARNNRQK